MKSSTALAAVAAILLLPASAVAAPPSAADRAALETLARNADAAWDRRDAAAMSLHYAEDGNLRFAGMRAPVQGRAAVRAFFERSFAGRTGTLRHLTSVEHVDLPRPDLAVSDARVVVERQVADGSWKPVGEFVNTSVLVRERDGWKLSSVRAQPAPAATGQTATR